MKRPEITWSLMHPTPLDPAYVKKLVGIAEKSNYHVDSFEICGQCHTPYGGLDGLINYREYPSAFANWDQAAVAGNQQKLNEILSISHAAGKAVYLWHREVMIPPGLLTDIPALLDEDGEFDLTGDAFADLIRYKLARTFENVPGLDGLVLTLTEADYSAIHNSNTEKYPPVAVVSFIISIFASELEKRGKRFIMRSFGSIAEDYECILAGAEALEGRHKFEIETKITPYDFVPFLPPNPFLRQSSGFTLSAECEVVGEFMGQGNMPFEHVHNLVRYVREGQAADVDRFVIRVDRRGNCIFDLYEINYYAYERALMDENITADEIRQEWYEKHYPADKRDALIELDKMGWEMVCKTYFIDKHVLFHGNYCMKYIKAAYVFGLFAEGRRTLANGKGIWSILTDRNSPGRGAIFEEKEQAVVLADKGLALLKSLDLPPDDFRHRLWENAPIVTRAVREMILCFIYYFDDMEWEKPDHPHLKAQVASSMKEFERLAGHQVEIIKREVINGLEHRTKELNRTIEELVIEPLAAICQELLKEFPAEYAAKEKFLHGCEDGIITGGITDDWRIVRYMHASHSMLYNGLPSRWAGNRVFPNGFMEMELKRGKELIIHGAPDQAKKFTLTCDGKTMVAEFDENGIFSMPLTESDKPVLLRLEKCGAEYPVFHAVLTRNPGWDKKPRIPLFSWNTDRMDRALVPEAVYDENPDWVEFYYAAWQSAWTHIFSTRGAPVSPYMNEGIRCHKIWIWDTCFMVQFCRYAADVFPGIESLDNFYRVMHDGENMVLKVHIPDNPPLFAWTEYEYFKHTGDVERVKHILLEKEYLQRHYNWLNGCKAGVLFDYATSITGAELVPGKGFKWSGAKAGMDNTPRGDDDFLSIYYVDLSCQQALSALYISRLAEAIGEKELAAFWRKEFEAQKKLVNERFWSEADQMYLDRFIDESGFCKLLTPASLWPMLAEIADEKQLEALAKVVADPEKLGGERPIPSVSRDDRRFSPVGEYWRGGIWMPKVYMTVKGLEKNGRQTLADEVARKMISLQYRTWKNFEPHTIWECYSPTEDKPATNKVGGYSRPDFCGWSALGPISMFIENILGIREVNALENRIVWEPAAGKRNGIKNLKMGSDTFTLIADPEAGSAEVTASKDFTLVLNNREYTCKTGKNMIYYKQ